MKEEGNKQYSGREFKKALATWEQARALEKEGEGVQPTAADLGHRAQRTAHRTVAPVRRA